MAGTVFGTGSSYNPTTGATTAQNTLTASGAGSASTTSPSSTGAAPVQQTGDTSGFQLASQSTLPGTSLTGVPSWMDDFTKSGGTDLNAYYQKLQGYTDLSKQAIPTDPTPQLPTAATPAAAAPAAAAAAAPAAKPQYTVIPMNAAGGYNSPGQMGSFTVNDQWDGYGSRQVGTPQYTPPQLMSGPIYTDGKGGYFSKDPSGKIVPIGSGGGPGDTYAADYVKKFFDAQGYGAQT